MEAVLFKPFNRAGHHRSHTSHSNYPGGLSAIHEEEEWSSSHRSKAPTPIRPKKQYMRRHCNIYNTPAALSSNPRVADYQQFLSNLKRFPDIFHYFLGQSLSLNILSMNTVKSSEYYYKYIHFSNHYKFSQAKNQKVSDKTEETSVISYTSSDDESFDSRQPLNVDDKARLMKFIKENSKPHTKVFRPKSRKRKNIIPKRTVLNRSKPKLVQIFLAMCGTNTSLKSSRLTNYLFKHYLQRKFPNEMAEAMSKHFDFKSSNFDDFCVEMDRFICSGDEKHYTMCFECFDLNKDKYLCYQDTYSAIELRRENIYDSDLIKIRKMFEMKKNGEIISKKPEGRRNRRLSVMSLASEVSSFQDDPDAKKISYTHPDKPEALVLEDFLKIDFKGKPQILKNFFLFTCNYDIESLKETVTPIVKSRRQSEELIFEIKMNKDFLDIPEDDEKKNYYLELDEAMNLFHIATANELLKKFEFLRDKNFHEFKTISLNSMIENWPKVFGTKCDYISERFYFYFAGHENFDVTKARFLKMIFKASEFELSPRDFSFSIYDQKSDWKITPDEINRMERSLPCDSPIHCECMVLVNEFIASIFGRKRKPISCIEPLYFSELVPDSLFYKEFRRFTDTPLEDLLKTQNPSFLFNV